MNSLKNLKKAIKRSEARGAPEGHALPSRLWNTRKFISEGLAKHIDQKNSLQEASAQLYPIVDMLTDQIEKGAPGFKENYLPRYAEYSRKLDAMNYLQRKSLISADEKIKLGSVHTVLEEIRRARISKNSTSGAAAVSEDQIAKLEALKHDLMRVSQTNRKKGSFGSNTAKNLTTQGAIRKHIGGAMGATAAELAGSVLDHAGGFGGYLAGNFIKNALTGEKAAREFEEKVIEELLKRHLPYRQ